MPTLVQVRDRVDDWLGARWPTLVSRQDAYMAAHGGRPFQGKWSTRVWPEHTTTADGDATPDNLDDKPSDQAESWRDFMSELNTPLPAIIWIDVYFIAGQWGWVANIALKYNGTIYHRARNVGPETWRTKPWRADTV